MKKHVLTKTARKKARKASGPVPAKVVAPWWLEIEVAGEVRRFCRTETRWLRSIKDCVIFAVQWERRYLALRGLRLSRVRAIAPDGASYPLTLFSKEDARDQNNA